MNISEINDIAGRFDISDSEAKRIAAAANNEAEFIKIWENDDWWTDGNTAKDKLMTDKFTLPLCAYEDASKAIAKLIKEKIGKPKYRLERRAPETRDFSESPTSFGVTETWELTDTFGSFLDGPNGETHATYIPGFGIAAETYEDDIYKILDDEIGGAFFGKYTEYWDDMEKFYDSGEAQDFVSEQKFDFFAQVKSDYEGDTLNETIKALETAQ